MHARRVRVLVIAALVWIGSLDGGAETDARGTDHALVELVTADCAALPKQLDPPLVLATATLHRSSSEPWSIDADQCSPSRLRSVDLRERVRRCKRRPRMRSAPESDH